MLDLNKSSEFLMKTLSFITLLILAGCSSGTPVNIEDVLYERSGRFITGDNYSNLFFKNQKVYSGPGFRLYRSGEKMEEGTLKNGWKSGVWTGYYKDKKKKFVGSYKKGKSDGGWIGYYRSGEKKYEGNYYNGFQVGTWSYYNKKGQKKLEEVYFICTDECEETHPPDRRGTKYICANLGKIVDEKKF